MQQQAAMSAAAFSATAFSKEPSKRPQTAVSKDLLSYPGSLHKSVWKPSGGKECSKNGLARDAVQFAAVDLWAELGV